MTEGNVEIYSLTKDSRDHFDKDEILRDFCICGQLCLLMVKLMTMNLL